MYTSKKKILPNGLEVLITPIPHVHLSALYAYVKMGTTFEEEEEYGSSHLLEHLLLKRITTHKHREIEKFCTSRGMYINAATSMEFTSFYMLDMLPTHIEQALEFMRDILFVPVATPEDLEQEKEIVISEIKDIQSNPNHKMHLAFSKYFFGDHPIGREVGGTEESVRNITFDDLMQFHKKHYVPSNITLSVAGPIEDMQKIEKAIDSHFGGIPKGEKKGIDLPTIQFPEKKDFLFLMDYVETVTLQYFWLLPGRKHFTDQEEATFRVFEYVFGGSRFSRLLMRVREQHQFVYEISCSRYYEHLYGAFEIETSLREEYVEQARDAIHEELVRMQNELITQEELEEAQTSLLVSYNRLLDDVSSIASSAIRSVVLKDKVLLPDREIELMKNVTPENVRDIVNKYIDINKSYTFVTAKHELSIPHLFEAKK